MVSSATPSSVENEHVPELTGIAPVKTIKRFQYEKIRDLKARMLDTGIENEHDAEVCTAFKDDVKENFTTQAVVSALIASMTFPLIFEEIDGGDGGGDDSQAVFSLIMAVSTTIGVVAVLMNVVLLDLFCKAVNTMADCWWWSAKTAGHVYVAWNVQFLQLIFFFIGVCVGIHAKFGVNWVFVAIISVQCLLFAGIMRFWLPLRKAASERAVEKPKIRTKSCKSASLSFDATDDFSM